MGAASSHPAGDRLAPSGVRGGIGKKQFHAYWSLRPEEPDRFYRHKRYDKFRELPEVTKPVWSFDLAEFTMVLAAAVADHGVHLWDLLMDPPELKVTLRAHKAHVWAVQFSPNELVLATASGDKTVRIWNAETGMPLQLLEAHTEGVRCLSFSMDGLLLSGGMDSQICLWEFDCNVPSAQWKAHDGDVHSIAFVRNRMATRRSLALSVGADGFVAAWHVEEGNYKALGRFAGGGGQGVLCVEQHTRYENWCACGNQDGGVWLWNFKEGNFDMGEVGNAESALPTTGHIRLVGHRQGVRTLAFTPDGCLLASGSAEGQVRVWNVAQMHTLREAVCVAVFNAHDSWVTQVRFEGGSRGLVTCSADGLVTHWVAPSRIRKFKAEAARFIIVVQRMPGFSTYSLGIDWKFVNNNLLACKVSDTGLVAEWNRHNPGRALVPGDQVVCVNGLRQDPRAMLEESRTAQTVQLEIIAAQDKEYRAMAKPGAYKPLRVKADYSAKNDEEAELRLVNEKPVSVPTGPDEEDVKAANKVKRLFLPELLGLDSSSSDDNSCGSSSSDGSGSHKRGRSRSCKGGSQRSLHSQTSSASAPTPTTTSTTLALAGSTATQAAMMASATTPQQQQQQQQQQQRGATGTRPSTAASASSGMDPGSTERTFDPRQNSLPGQLPLPAPSEATSPLVLARALGSRSPSPSRLMDRVVTPQHRQIAPRHLQTHLEAVSRGDLSAAGGTSGFSSPAAGAH